MRFGQKAVAVALVLSMIVGVCAMADVPKQAQAADGDIYFTTADFQKAYAKVLFSLVGKGYKGGGGYHVSAGGTPLSPAATSDTKFDCCGFVVTGLMMMGYDYFVDSSGKKWNLDAQTGMDVFQGTKGIFYSHKTGDKITLHNKTDERFNVTFKFGEVIDMATAADIPMGAILCSLPTTNSSGNYDSSNNNGVVYGAFGEHYIGSSYKTHIGHCSVALFTMDKTDDITKDNYRNKTSAERKTALETSWDRAAGMIESLLGTEYKTKVTGGSIRNSAYDISEQHFAPYLWDARGRGYGYYTNSDATATNYKAGFKDPRCTAHFNTPYSRVWQIECLNETVGVCVNNNPYGKTVAITQSVYIEPVDSYGTVEIKKSDELTQTMISGAKFTLYEWSAEKNGYVISKNYRIQERGATGQYYTYKGDDLDKIIVYFSWSGNSQKMARWIAEETGADIFRIVPEDAYSKEYSEVTDRAKKEKDEGTRPALSEHIPADIMAKYDVIYLGYPVWWYDLPMPVWSFLEEYDLSGKTIVPYFSHEGSSNGAGSLGRISELAPNSTVKTGDALSIRGGKVSSSENEVKAWVRGLKLE